MLEKVDFGNSWKMSDIDQNGSESQKETNHIVCEICEMVFNAKLKLKYHFSAVHKFYKCESCGKLFLQVQNLKRHIHTIHDDRKDYKC